MKEIFPFNNQDNNYVDSSYKYEDFKGKDVNVSNYKMYTLAYQQYAKQHDYKLKKLTYHFVSPHITKESFELAFILNHGYRKINDIDIKIYLYTYQTFYNQLLNLIPKDKWFIYNAIPFNCFNAHDVKLLVQDKRAQIV